VARGVRFEIKDEDPFAEGPLTSAEPIPRDSAGEEEFGERLDAKPEPGAAEAVTDDQAARSEPTRPRAGTAGRPNSRGPNARERGEGAPTLPWSLAGSPRARRIAVGCVVLALLLASGLGAGKHSSDEPRSASPRTVERAAPASVPRSAHRHRPKHPTHRRRRHTARRQRRLAPAAAAPRNPAPPADAPATPQPPRSPHAAPDPAAGAGGGEFSFER
jgi:hypothetical protein